MAPQQRTRRSDRWREVASQFVLVFAAAMFYFLVRGATQGSVERSEGNADRILRIERSVGLDLERPAQRFIETDDVLVTLSNWVYIWGHWPVLIVTLYGLHRWHPNDYLRLRNALFVSGMIGMLIYATFPVAPPRLLDGEFRDTVTELSKSYRVLQPPALTNKYAAMPSLHAGWNMLAGIALYRVAHNRVLKALGVIGPIAMAFAVVATGNHFVLDVVGGVIVALAGSLVADRWWPTAGRATSGLLEPATELADEPEVVDDQPGASHLDQLDRPPRVGHRPGAQMLRRPSESCGHRRRQQPLVDDDAVVRGPPT